VDGRDLIAPAERGGLIETRAVGGGFTVRLAEVPRTERGVDTDMEKTASTEK
jgi:hypothetical protein